MTADSTAYEVLRFIMLAVGFIYLTTSLLAAISDVLRADTPKEGETVRGKRMSVPFSRFALFVDDYVYRLSGKEQPLHGAKIGQIKKAYWHKLRFPALPNCLVKMQDDLTRRTDEILKTSHRLLLTGDSGTGKTTIAIQMGERYKGLNGESPLKQLPVYLNLAKPGTQNEQKNQRLKGITIKDIGEEISNFIEQSIRLGKQQVADMLEIGQFFLIIDDIDYLMPERQKQLEEFVKHFNKNTFMWILSKRPETWSFLSNFEEVCLSGWDELTTKHYLRNMVRSESSISDLFAQLDELGIFQEPITPLEASCIAKAYLKDPTHSIVLAQDLQQSTRQRILLRYLRLIVKTSKLDEDWVIQVLGALALRQLINERSYFLELEAREGASHLQEFVPDLFSKTGSVYAFSHFQYQLLLASMFRYSFPDEARKIIGDRPEDKLLWRPWERSELAEH